MLWFNAHIVKESKVEEVLNSHVKKGYDLRYIRNTGKMAKGGEGLVQLIFQQEIAFEKDWEAQFAERYKEKPKPDLPAIDAAMAQ